MIVYSPEYSDLRFWFTYLTLSWCRHFVWQDGKPVPLEQDNDPTCA